jgi:hypothetical protein
MLQTKNDSDLYRVVPLAKGITAAARMLEGCTMVPSELQSLVSLSLICLVLPTRVGMMKT